MKLGDKEQIRAVFERVFDGGGRLKAKQAKYFFKRWLTFEEKEGDDRRVEDVKARAALWVRSVKGDEDVEGDGN
jgi:rRNA biogenesis protein RRP5